MYKGQVPLLNITKIIIKFYLILVQLELEKLDLKKYNGTQKRIKVWL